MSNPEPPSETERLRHTLGSMVTLSNLPSIWRGAGLDRIAETLADALQRTLSLRWIQVNVSAGQAPPVVLMRVGSAQVPAMEVEEVAATARDRGAITWTDRSGERALRVVRVPLGYAETVGWFIAASERPDFPTAGENLLIHLTANQSAMAIEAYRSEATRRELTKRSELLAAIVASSSDAIASKTLDGVITSWNRGAERMFGYPAEEMIGTNVMRIIPPELHHEEHEILARLRHGESISHYETVRLHRDGTPLDVSISISPVRDELDRVVGASKIVRDMSERKRAERERVRLLDQEREARQEAEILNDLARRLGGALELDALVQLVTEAGLKVTGARIGAFFQNVREGASDRYLLGAIAGARREEFEHFIAPPVTPLFEPTFRGEVVRLDDAIQDPRFGQNPPRLGPPEDHLPLRSYLAVPVLSRAGEIIGALCFGHPLAGIFGERAERLASGLASQAAICFESAQLYRKAQEQVAERRLSEERERAARTEAERASRLRDEFLATVSHELRTPLNSLLGWVQVLRRSPDDPELRGQAFDAIERAARAQTRLVDDLLDMSRIISGKLRLDVQLVDLVPVIQEAIATIRPAAEARSIDIDAVLAPQAGQVRGDPARIQQVLWNLLSNAVKFTPRGGRVEVVLEQLESHVQIRVSDTGCGIPPEFLPYAFERFRQADSTTKRAFGGLGLGLAIVKQLVEMHGGKVWVASPGLGQGATFGFQLPVTMARNLVDAPGGSGSEADVGAGDAELRGVSALVVDDDVDSCAVLRRVLEDRGAAVSTVHAARDALALIARRPFDVLVSDIGMPEMDGYELIKDVRARGIQLPAVAVTAFARPDDRIRSIRAGYTMHLSKPIEPRELIAVVSALARRREPSAGG